MKIRFLALGVVASLSLLANAGWKAEELTFQGVDESYVRASNGGSWVGYVSNITITQLVGSPSGRQISSTPSTAVWMHENRMKVLDAPGYINTSSEAFSHDSVGGYALQDRNAHPLLWSLKSGAVTDLLPSGATSGLVSGVAGPYQAGSINKGPASRAILWRGTAASARDMTPVGAECATLLGIVERQKDVFALVGSIGDGGHAAYWPSLDSAPIDLHPAGATFSGAYSADADSQVGTVDGKPSLWQGTAASWVNLLPAGADSGIAMAVDGAYQVGSVKMGNSQSFQAAFWQGSAGSFVDLSLLFRDRTIISSEAKSVTVSGNAVVVYGTVTRTKKVFGSEMPITHAARWTLTP